MILILCDEADSAAHWAAAGLAQRGLRPSVLTDRDLASVRGWKHTIAAHGASIELRLAGGTVRGEDVHGVLNRLTFVPRAWLRQAGGGADSAYATQELLAFFLSWLYALEAPTLNPPAPQGLCGNVRHPASWIDLAVRAGLPVVSYAQSSDDDPALPWRAAFHPRAQTVLVAAGAVFGPPTLVGAHGAACLRLSDAAGCPILGVDFAPCGGGAWGVCSASVTPDLTAGGAGLIDALAAVFAR